jgi:hypothetical protein
MDVGVEFGHYKVLEHIGRGGMADVWSARDVRLARTVAVKTIARNLARDIDPVRLFEREAQTIAALEHPHILPIYEFGDYSSQLYIVMRYVSGGSLDDVLERGPLEIDEMLRVARAIGQALEYAHASKVIHLDLKPSNILLDSYQSPYLADFGLAAVLNPEGRARNPGSGTLLYMAPEQLTDDELDHRADIYSFGIMLFHMLTGQLPFDAAVPLAIKQLQTGEVLPELGLLRPGLPPVLDSILREATELELDRRANSMRNLVRALEHVLGGGGVLSADTRRAPTGGVFSETRGLVSLETNALASGPPVPEPRLPGAPRADTAAAPPEEAMEGLLSRPGDGHATLTGEANAEAIEQYISGPIDDLIRRGGDTAALDDIAEPATAPIADIISRRVPVGPKLDSLMSGPIEQLLSRIGPVMPDEPAAPPPSPEALALQEAEAIYHRARRAYQRGQGRFALSVTDFVLIADYYRRAEAHGLELDDSGQQVLLRGAFEYDHDLDYWWLQLDDDARRWTAIHTLRSQNAPARTRALERLLGVPDAEPPQIPVQVAQMLQVETHSAARLAAIEVLGARAPLPPHQPPWWEKAGLWRVSQWREVAYSAEIDLVLAAEALNPLDPPAAALAARVIGRLRSSAAIRAIVQARRNRTPGALRALALARDEANSLPPGVDGSDRILAWMNNSWRRASEDPLRTMWRLVAMLIACVLAMSMYLYLSYSYGGGALLIAEIWGRSVSIGLTFGMLFSITMIVADEVPQRLRGFWTWWARGLWAAVFGMALGTVTWGLFRFLILYDPDVNWNVAAIGGSGIAAAALVLNLTRLPGVVRTLLTALCLYVPLWWAWDQFWNFETLPVAPIQFYEFEQVYTWLIPMIVLIALGVNARAVWADLRALSRRLRGARPGQG